MLNKVKRILQWFIGGCYILSGLACIGEYTMPAIILIILGGVIILPPITKRIPAFKFKKIALILLSSIVMIAGIQLGETNLSPEVLAKRKAESEAAAASQAALEAQEAAESASRAAEEEAASKAAQEKAESEAAVATENEIASMGCCYVGEIQTRVAETERGGAVRGQRLWLGHGYHPDHL